MALKRRKVRYFCFRLQKEAEAGITTDGLDIPEGFKENFEEQKLFNGWSEFGKSWDVAEDEPMKVVFRKFTIYEEWNATLRAVVPTIPIKVDPWEDKAKKATAERQRELNGSK